MGIMFRGEEMIKTAIEIEKNGIVFYEVAAKGARQPKLKEACLQFAEQEREHQALFEKMLASLGKEEAVDDEDASEEERYIKSLADHTVFTGQDTLAKVLRQTVGIDVVSLAIDMEKDSILFYSEVRSLVKAAERHAIDQIIDEERAHVLRLFEFWKQ